MERQGDAACKGRERALRSATFCSLRLGLSFSNPTTIHEVLLALKPIVESERELARGWARTLAKNAKQQSSQASRSFPLVPSPPQQLFHRTAEVRPPSEPHLLTSTLASTPGGRALLTSSLSSARRAGDSTAARSLTSNVGGGRLGLGRAGRLLRWRGLDGEEEKGGGAAETVASRPP